MSNEKVNVNNPAFAEMEKARLEQGKYIKMKSGESRVFVFDALKVKLVEREFKNKDGTTRKSKVGNYIVIDPNTQTEHELDLGLSWALNLNDILKEGFQTIKITRKGEAFDTSYSFVPVK